MAKFRLFIILFTLSLGKLLAAEFDYANALEQEVKSLLPINLRPHFEGVHFSFRGPSEQLDMDSTCRDTSNYDRLFKISKKEIALNKNLEVLFKTSYPISDCIYKNSRRLVTSIALKAIAIIYNNKLLVSKSEADTIYDCFIKRNRYKDLAERKKCEYYNHSYYGFKSASRTYDYGVITNWNNLNDAKNIDWSRLPDRDFSINQDHSFFTDFSLFLADPDYACRRPLNYYYFSKWFQHQPFVGRCDLNSILRIHNTLRTAIDFKPENIIRIDYLLATAGKGDGAGFGHSMLRIVFCDKNMMSEKMCLNDPDQSVVVSFRANVNDIKLSKLKGLLGGYDSKMYLIPFKDIINEYVNEQGRALKSIPLNFNAEQRKMVIYKVLQDYWNYNGDYKFITENCATETLHLIKAALPKTEFLEESRITPYGVWGVLSSYKLTNEDKIKEYKRQVSELKKFALILNHNIKLDEAYSSFMGMTFEQHKNLFEKLRSEYEQLKNSNDLVSLTKLHKKFNVFKIYYPELIDLKQKQVANKSQKIAIEFANAHENEAFEFMKSFIANNQNLVKFGYGVPMSREVLETNYEEKISKQKKYIFDHIPSIAKLDQEFEIDKERYAHLMSELELTAYDVDESFQKLKDQFLIEVLNRNQESPEVKAFMVDPKSEDLLGEVIKLINSNAGVELVNSNTLSARKIIELLKK